MFRFTITLLFVSTLVLAVIASIGDPDTVRPVAWILFAFIWMFLLVLAFLSARHWIAYRCASMFYNHKLTNIHRLFFGAELTALSVNELGVELFENMQYSASFDAFSVAIEFNNQRANFWANRGAARYEMADHVSTLEDCSKAIRLEERNRGARLYRGLAHLALGNFTDALNDLMFFECTSIGHAMTAYIRGTLHERAENWRSALDDYLLAFSLDANLTNAGIAMARLQAGCPDDHIRNGTLALENALNMHRRGTADGWITASVLGAAYSEIGDFDQALKYAKIALETAPEPEKEARRLRIKQFENRQPFRLTGNPILPVNVPPAP